MEHKKEVLVVVGDPVLSDWITELMRDSLPNVTVTSFDNPEMAKHKIGQSIAKDQPPAVILTSLKFPIGYDFLNWLHGEHAFKSTQSIPVIVTAGDLEMRAEVERLKAEFMIEPFNIDDIVESLKNKLGT